MWLKQILGDYKLCFLVDLLLIIADYNHIETQHNHLETQYHIEIIACNQQDLF